ncbi:TRAP transporter small permease [Bradyrhizobium sp. BR 1433]|uniref:TRAP transporter small permease n=1 Tax=Bradyrhizobium sp. BR 1433 TaxID=3447967 RepID=UPI003EE4D46B
MMKIWNRLELLLIGVLGAAALTVGTAQVIGRYVNKDFAFINGEEVVVYLTVWAVFLASSQLVRTDGHVRPDVVLRLLPPQGQRWVEAFNCCVAILFCGGLAYCGFQVADVARSLDERSITGLEFPMWIYYSAILTGAVLMLLRYVIKLYLLVFRFDPATMVIAVHDH